MRHAFEIARSSPLADALATPGELGPNAGSLSADATDAELDTWMFERLRTGHHTSCTCKMGPASDTMAVVDQHGNVHGLEGLRIIDASIMPSCIRANTHAPTLMIARHATTMMLAGRGRTQ